MGLGGEEKGRWRRRRRRKELEETSATRIKMQTFRSVRTVNASFGSDASTR